MTVPRAVFRYVEYELYSFEASKRQLEELRADILAKAQPPIGLVKIGAETNKNPESDYTSATAIELVTSSALVRLSRRIIEVEEALRQLTPRHQQIFKLKYCEGLDWQEICEALHVEQNTYYKCRRELILMVAIKMSLM